MTAIPSPASLSPWHEGERAMQRRAGVLDRMAATGLRVIRPLMPDQHREFFSRLPFALAGFADRAGDVWASLLAGQPGFIQSPDAGRLEIAARPFAGDPLAEAMAPGEPLGLLGIELPTRRRNRANGRVGVVDECRFSLDVEESFGNCPKYIVRREYGLSVSERPASAEPVIGLDDEDRRLVAAASTIFVASSAGAKKLPDISHRGGQAGFVRLGSDDSLTVPDYAGNLYFNTLGNFSINPRAGLLFVNFENGDVLQLTGGVELVFDGPAVTALPGAQRAWRFFPQRGIRLRGALPLRFSGAEISPFSPPIAAG